MRKNILSGGRIFALLFLLCMLFAGTQSAYAASNVWGRWQTAISEDKTYENSFIVSAQNTFSVELWHYSGGYWGNNFVRIYDKQVFDDPDQLAEAVNAVMEFDMALPNEVISLLNDGYNVDVVMSANGIPLNNIFNLNKGFTFKYENGKIVFKAYPKFNFDKRYNYRDHFVAGLNKAIPFVAAPYGYNRYAMWTKNGRSVGAANGFFNPDNIYDTGSEGIIHPSQIKNNLGYLQSDLNIYVDRENGTFDWMSSNNIAIGYKTFANAGAVAVHFDYPVTISFYKGGKMTDIPNGSKSNGNPELDDEPTEPEQPNLPDDNTSSCGEVIRWTEEDSHTVTKSCRRHGSHKYTCKHKFIYETSLSAEYTMSPKTLKSGYGFAVDLNTSVSTRLVSHSGGCDSWGNNRSPQKTVQAPTKADVKLNYTVTNVIGTQGNTVPLERTANSGTQTVFTTAENPISIMKSRSIYTEVSLAGTAENPETHNYDIYIYGGGVNGVEFCKTITDSFVINGSMFDDDGTTS